MCRCSWGGEEEISAGNCLMNPIPQLWNRNAPYNWLSHEGNSWPWGERNEDGEFFFFFILVFTGLFKSRILLVNCMGNPWVFLAIPAPIPMVGFTHEHAGFLVETSPRSSKMVKYWVSYEQNNQIDHNPSIFIHFGWSRACFEAHGYRNPYPYLCNTLDITPSLKRKCPFWWVIAYRHNHVSSHAYVGLWRGLHLPWKNEEQGVWHYQRQHLWHFSGDQCLPWPAWVCWSCPEDCCWSP